MPHPFPHHYQIRLSRTPGGIATIQGEGLPQIQGGATVQFDGKPGFWSPEDLLLSSIALCFMTTFQSFLAKTQLALHDFRAETVGVLEKTTAGLVFTRFELKVQIQAPTESHEPIRALATKAEKYCIISNSLKTPVTLQLTLTG